MRCGHCKNEGVDVAHVKRCSQGATPAQHQQGALWGWNDSRPVRPMKPTELRRDVEQAALLAQINKIGAEIPAGWYAIRNQGGDNDISFYVIERPERGKWAGKTFIKQQISDELAKIPRARQLQILTAIAADPRGASALYGHSIGRCGICHRTLTNEVSRAAGIGPKCAAAHGWGAA